MKHVLFALMILSAAAGTCSYANDGVVKKPNIVIILADDFGYELDGTEGRFEKVDGGIR